MRRVLSAAPAFTRRRRRRPTCLSDVGGLSTSAGRSAHFARRPIARDINYASLSACANRRVNRFLYSAFCDTTALQQVGGVA